MKKFIKQVGTACSAAVVVSVLAACGGGGGGGGTASPAPTPSAPTPSAPAPEPTPTPTPTGMVPVTSPATDLLLTEGSSGIGKSLTTDVYTQGIFGQVMPWPFVAVHANLLPNGRVLTYGATGGRTTDPLRSRTWDATQWGLDFGEWTPEAGTATTAHVVKTDQLQYDSFCSTSKMLPDGTLMIASGNGPDTTRTLSPNDGYSSYNGQSLEKTTQFWSPDANTASAGSLTRKAGLSGLAQKRWYSSLVRMPDDSVVVLGGGAAYVADAYYVNSREVAFYPEKFVPGQGWSPLATGCNADGTTCKTLNGDTNTSSYPGFTTYNDAQFWRDRSRWWYPRAYLARNGKVFMITGDTLLQLDTANGAMREVGNRLPDRVIGQGSTTKVVGVSNTSVMYAPGKILVAGGGQYSNGEDFQPASSGAVVVDIDTLDGAGNVAATWANTAGQMANARSWGMATVLPDGKVWIDGGVACGTGFQDCNGRNVDFVNCFPAYSLTSELWNPVTQLFSTAATATKGRTYHHISLLLPSGAVLVASSGVPAPENQLNAEVYYPPYLFKQDSTTGQPRLVRASERPTFTSISQTLAYNTTFKVTLADARTISSMSFITTGSVTHSHNNDQRRVPLAFTQSGNQLTVTMPASPNLMAPGPYMLFAVDSAGVPSRGHIVDIAKP